MTSLKNFKNSSEVKKIDRGGLLLLLSLLLRVVVGVVGGVDLRNRWGYFGWVMRVGVLEEGDWRSCLRGV